ncbi:non-specific serine/threonine protein kinase [Ranunculus cassubicifolius]
MDDRWRYNRFRMKRSMSFVLILCLVFGNFSFGLGLNDEGLSLLKFRERVSRDPYGALLTWNFDEEDEDPCSWDGIECSDGKVTILNLKDLCLEGTLAPELGNLIHVKAIVLRNNSFYGAVPEGFKELKDLEVLDLGFNNISGPVPLDLGNNLSLTILLLDNNELLESLTPELHDLWKLSEIQVDDTYLSGTADGASCNRRSISGDIVQAGDVVHRRQLQISLVPPTGEVKRKSPPKKATTNKKTPPTPSSIPPSPSPSSFPPSPSPSPSPSSFPPSPSPSPKSLSPPSPSPSPSPSSPSSPPPAVVPTVLSAPSPSSRTGNGTLNTGIPSHSKSNTFLIVLVVIGGAAILSLLFVLLLLRGKKRGNVKPWVTGLSGQLQKAFVTGVPKLKRPELVTACEDFSNIISSSSEDTVYKGTLSSGVEIAVTSTTVTSSKDWSEHLETAFRNKIDTLSKVNHKNFVNLLGFCEEEDPFTRMIIFEYAPNGTLFEHLHIKESEHLDWKARLRIAMGIAYCLEYMHQLDPPVVHKKLHSSTIYLTEDYAAKISDFGFWNEATMAKMRSAGMDDTPSTLPENNIYSFGVILLEMITGRLSNSLDDGPLVNWASEFIVNKKPLKDMVDPTLNSFHEEDIEKLCNLIGSCIHPDPSKRPKIKEVSARLREITAVSPDGATPRLSPLWWAELEILSTSEGS